MLVPISIRLCLTNSDAGAPDLGGSTDPASPVPNLLLFIFRHHFIEEHSDSSPRETAHSTQPTFIPDLARRAQRQAAAMAAQHGAARPVTAAGWDRLPPYAQSLQGMDAPMLGMAPVGPDASPLVATHASVAGYFPAATAGAGGGYVQQPLQVGYPTQVAAAAAAAGAWLVHVVVRAVYEGGGELRAADGPHCLKARLLRDAPTAVGEMAAAGGLARFCQAHADRLEFIPDPGGGGGVVRLRGAASVSAFLGGTSAYYGGPAVMQPPPPVLPEVTLAAAAAAGTPPIPPSMQAPIPQPTLAAVQPGPSPRAPPPGLSSHGTAPAPAPTGSRAMRAGVPKAGGVEAGMGAELGSPRGRLMQPSVGNNEALRSAAADSGLPNRFRLEEEEEEEEEEAPARRNVVCVSTGAASGASSVAGRPRVAEYNALEIQRLRAIREMVVRGCGGGSGGGGSSGGGNSGGGDPAVSHRAGDRRVERFSGAADAPLPRGGAGAAPPGRGEGLAERLARLVLAAGGEMIASRAAVVLYGEAPGVREEVAAAGGLRGVCDGSAGLLELERDNCGGVVRLRRHPPAAHVSKPVASGSVGGAIERRGPSAPAPTAAGPARPAAESRKDEVRRAILVRLVEALRVAPDGVLLAAQVPARVVDGVPGGREAVLACGGLRSFCLAFPAELDYVADSGGRNLVRLRPQTGRGAGGAAGPSAVVPSTAAVPTAPASGRTGSNGDTAAAQAQGRCGTGPPVSRDTKRPYDPVAAQAQATQAQATQAQVAQAQAQAAQAAKAQAAKAAKAAVAVAAEGGGGEGGEGKSSASASASASANLVAVALVQLLLRKGRGVEVPAPQLCALLYRELPSARDVVTAAGGIRRFCLTHADRFEFVTDAGGRCSLRFIGTEAAAGADSARAAAPVPDAPPPPSSAPSPSPAPLLSSQPRQAAAKSAPASTAAGKPAPTLATPVPAATVPTNVSHVPSPAPPTAVAGHAAPEAAAAGPTAAVGLARAAGTAAPGAAPRADGDDAVAEEAAATGAAGAAVVERLVGMLRRAGGALPSGVAVRRLYADAPWARDPVAAAGGFRRLCAAHAAVLELCAGAGGSGGWCVRLVGGASAAPAPAPAEQEPACPFSLDAFPDLSPKPSTPVSPADAAAGPAPRGLGDAAAAG